MATLDTLVTAFRVLYGAPPEKIARAPGRVNLIGEHTDYNGGFVMPIAIDRDVLIAARPRQDDKVCVTALDVRNGQSDEFSLADISHHPDYRWANYVRGVAFYLAQQNVKLKGMDAVITSNLPSGAGLSSSAALEVCTATILLAFTSSQLGGLEVAQVCQKAENHFVGVKSGIMDQYASALGEKGAALKIDCRALTYETVKLPRGYTIVVADTNKKRHLAGSDYNTRWHECENAKVLLAQLLHKRVDTLRDVSLKEFKSVANFLPENLMKRARHVLTENERVQKAARAAKNNEPEKFGALMNESQASLRDDYDASSPELDIMVEIARAQKGCVGSRLTGAGWGGATVNLVQNVQVKTFIEKVTQEYQAHTQIAAWVAPVHASQGAGLMDWTQREGLR